MTLPSDTALNEPWIHACRQRGFAVLVDAVLPATVEQLLAAAAQAPASHAHRNLLQWPVIRAFAESREALRLVEPVLGTRAFPVRGILFDKLEGANWKVPWHQDLSIAVREKHELAGFGPWSVKEGVPHVQPPVHVLESMLTLRLHLDDCFADNGPVRVLPGTHARGVLDSAAIEAARREIPEVTTTMAKGGVLLMRPLLLHASSPATAPRHRRVVHIEYAAGHLPRPLLWYEN
jgi:hypothetical protein